MVNRLFIYRGGMSYCISTKGTLLGKWSQFQYEQQVIRDFLSQPINESRILNQRVSLQINNIVKCNEIKQKSERAKVKTKINNLDKVRIPNEEERKKIEHPSIRNPRINILGSYKISRFINLNRSENKMENFRTYVQRFHQNGYADNCKQSIKHTELVDKVELSKIYEESNILDTESCDLSKESYFWINTPQGKRFFKNQIQSLECQGLSDIQVDYIMEDDQPLAIMKIFISSTKVFVIKFRIFTPIEPPLIQYYCNDILIKNCGCTNWTSDSLISDLILRDNYWISRRQKQKYDSFENSKHYKPVSNTLKKYLRKVK